MKTTQSLFKKRALASLAAVALINFALPLQALPLQQGYGVSNLVSDLPGVAASQDPNLINPWGIAFDPSGDMFIAGNGDNLGLFYGPGALVLPFTITAGVAPTGIEYNPSSNSFNIGPVSNASPAELVMCTESGTILGFSFAVSLNSAITVVDDSASGAVYTGIAFGRFLGKEYLYAADFHNGKIKAYDSNFNFVGSFTDPHVDAGYAPFNIRNIAGFLFVSFAKENGQVGVGDGFVDIFTTDGLLVKRLIAHGNLNSPWGMTYVPFTFGKLGGSLLVGNFGDGHINAYNPITGQFLGTVSDTSNKAITIPGLWSLRMTPHIDAAGDDDCDNPLNTTLYFTSGPNGGVDGILGTIAPTATAIGPTPCGPGGPGNSCGNGPGH